MFETRRLKCKKRVGRMANGLRLSSAVERSYSTYNFWFWVRILALCTIEKEREVKRIMTFLLQEKEPFHPTMCD